MHPHKRRRVEESEDLGVTEGQYLQAILPEISLEIGLRRRLVETIESRIAWASLLQEILTNDPSSNSETSFKDVALESLHAVESRNRILYPSDATIPIITVAPPTQKHRPPPKEKPITRSQKAKFLFLRSNDRVFILRCPACLRHSFSSLQGLYNHSRISHYVEWGSHEECVKACAVPQQDFDQTLDLETGIDIRSTSQIGGILPSVRSLFQMAVDGAHAEPSSALDGGEGNEEDTGLYLTRTLGWHSDTPALAQFLGKEVTRKSIKIWDEDADVDVEGLDETTHQNSTRRRWRMPYLHRSRVKEDPTAESVGDSISPVLHQNSKSHLTKSDSITVRPHHETSRFHITCRVIITDHSLFIPEGRRFSHGTHKWMVTVESASYSLDLTSVLTNLTVSPLSDTTGMAASNMFDALSTKEPPFVVVGTTSEPFLAKIELKFTPSVTHREGQTVVLEHWVGLDMLGTTGPCKGDEQVVDIELDKDTFILPVKSGYLPVTSKVHWDNVTSTVDSNDRVGASNEPKQKEVDADGPLLYQGILQSLLPKFPMTIKDALVASNTRTKAAPRLPYKLVPGPVQLQRLVIGRRKAIEWARAKAIRDAYTDKIKDLRHSSDSKQLIPLTVGDVYCWLEDEGYFFRGQSREESLDSGKGRQTKGKVRDIAEEDKWCRACGLGLSLHLNTSASGASFGSDTSPPGAAPVPTGQSIDGASRDGAQGDFQCTIIPSSNWNLRFPMLDVEKVFQKCLQRNMTTIPVAEASVSPTMFEHPLNGPAHLIELAKNRRNRLMVSASDPVMTRFVLSQFGTSRLPISSALFTPNESHRRFPIHQLGMSSSTVDVALAPHAYLALATKQFIRALVEAALEVCNRDKDSAIASLAQTKHRQGQDHYPNNLTPVIFMQPGSTASGPRKKSASGNGRKKDSTNKIQTSIKILTPLHILGAVHNSQNTSRAALHTCLSRLGISLHGNHSETIMPESLTTSSSAPV
ncbi:hypothetical protein E1B28_009026 [Marasmius oreades]|uniref:YEATS domain-containing protein n=1 Tax=Marasmius oreades TaxID=181124 RepID=A0A9P7S085_9AGAR|nr:uncharacterized protein E1B28_009026 [Marasmius oreades]KAG7092695.1 hypothetical protein E1B28_009026 [Marasmius oreades]